MSAKEPAAPSGRHDALKDVVASLLRELKDGKADRDKRKQVEDWLRALGEKYPEFEIEHGLRDYYMAEAERLRAEFGKTEDLSEKLNIGRSIESYLDKATDILRRIEEQK